ACASICARRAPRLSSPTRRSSDLLISDAPIDRTAAMASLVTMGEPALPAIREAIRKRGEAQDQKTIWIAGSAGSPIVTRLAIARSEEHTSELQSRRDLVCRLLLEK